MPPTRRTRTRARMIVNHTSVAGENISASESAATDNLQGRSRRTLNSTRSSTTTNSTPPATNERYQKKTQKTGPARGRPIQFELTRTFEDEGDVQQREHTAIDNGGGGNKEKDPRSERDFSLQHQRSTGNAFFPPPIPPHSDEDVERDDNGNSTDAETEEEWLDSTQLAELARRFPSRMSEAMTTERPLWDDSTDAADCTLADVPNTLPARLMDAPVVVPHVMPAVVPAAAPSVVSVPSLVPIVAPTPTFAPVPALTPEPTDAPTRTPTLVPVPMPMPTVARGPDAVWPANTELIYVPGTTKIMLTAQIPVMRTVIQDAFEEVHAYILLNCAFPDASVVPTILREALIAAALSHMPRSSNIYNRLMMDDEYVMKLSRLPRARIPLFRGGVKEHCASIVQLGFVTLPLSVGQSIAQIAERQLSLYHYTYPTSGQGNPLTALPLRTKPYRNCRIITTIRQLYFEGGVNSFVRRFNDQFPRHKDDDGAMTIEVPIPMVALVATALYAAIYEWRAGHHQRKEFSANAFMDVYQGHIDTFNHIREHRNSAFHLMMSDIYSLANASAAIDVPGVPMATIDLNDLEH